MTAIYIYIYMYIYVYVYMNTHIYTYIYIYVYIYVYTCVFIHTYTHLFIHASCSLSRQSEREKGSEMLSLASQCEMESRKGARTWETRRGPMDPLRMSFKRQRTQPVWQTILLALSISNTACLTAYTCAAFLISWFMECLSTDNVFSPYDRIFCGLFWYNIQLCCQQTHVQLFWYNGS